MHLKHTCLPISPPEQGKKLVCSISYRQRLRKGVKKKNFQARRVDEQLRSKPAVNENVFFIARPIE